MSDEASERKLSLRIEAADDLGFVIWDAGRIVAALTSRAEVANWLEERLGSLPGERERESAEIAAVRADLPNIIRPETTAPGWRWRRT